MPRGGSTSTSSPSDQGEKKERQEKKGKVNIWNKTRHSLEVFFF